MTVTRREIVSFVRRSNRMRPQQLRAWDRHYADFGARGPPAARPRPRCALAALLDLTAAFGREAPLVVEVGPGSG